MVWNLEKINALTPDKATLERAKAIATPKKWKELQTNSIHIWGFAGSSGATFYRTHLDLETGHYYCSCPNINLPCKHILALLLLQMEQAAVFQQNQQVPDWLRNDAQRIHQSPSADAAQKQQEARDRTRDKRLEMMKAGAVDLERWLIGLVREGLARAREQPEAFWEETAARMVDAKLGSIGRRIRQWPAILYLEDWPARLLGEIAELFLFTQAFQNMERLALPVQQDLLVAGGMSQKKEAILKQPAISDHWLVIGQVHGAEESLRFRRTWMLGEKSACQALILDFSWGNQGFQDHWVVGSALQADLVFYPGNHPVRALVKRYERSTNPFNPPSTYELLENFADDYALAISQNPWLSYFPAFLNKVIPVFHNETLFLVDQQRRQIKARVTEENMWSLIALSGGNHLSVFGEWDGQQLTILSTLSESQLLDLGERQDSTI